MHSSSVKSGLAYLVAFVAFVRADDDDDDDEQCCIRIHGILRASIETAACKAKNTYIAPSSTLHTH